MDRGASRRGSDNHPGSRLSREHPFPIMKRPLRHQEDLAWLLRHSRGFRGGHLAEFHVDRRYLYDENIRRDVLAGTTVTVLIRYAIGPMPGAADAPIHRLARMRFAGVSDFSCFEQDGGHRGTIDAMQTEIHQGRLRFWFDQYGEVYVVCEEAELEEVAVPGRMSEAESMRGWVFQALVGTLPSVTWLLEQLDRAGLPCVWREEPAARIGTNSLHWTGLLALSAAGGTARAGAISIQGYGPLDGHAFGLAAETRTYDRGSDALLLGLVGIVTQHYAGDVLETTREHLRSLQWREKPTDANEGSV